MGQEPETVHVTILDSSFIIDPLPELDAACKKTVCDVIEGLERVAKLNLFLRGNKSNMSSRSLIVASVNSKKYYTLGELIQEGVLETLACIPTLEVDWQSFVNNAKTLSTGYSGLSGADTRVELVYIGSCLVKLPAVTSQALSGFIWPGIAGIKVLLETIKLK
ncbi:hypothetical protein FRC06_008349 [Ceratobasidium sp. 370]|nr:hypothetical protein FRC06_008349 [Ceratobasidium sp. 370]